MAENKYDKYVVHPGPSQIRAEDGVGTWEPFFKE